MARRATPSTARLVVVAITATLLLVATATPASALSPQSQRFDSTKDPLNAAAWKQDVKRVKQLLDAAGPVGSDPRRKLANRAGVDLGSPPPGTPWTPLWAALLSIEASSFAASRSPDALAVVKLLLEAGADARAPPPKGWADEGDTSLVFASRLAQNPDVVRLLVEFGAGGGGGGRDKRNGTAADRASWVNRRNAKGSTALFAAAACDWRVSGGDEAALGVVKMLLAAGANPALKNRQGCPPLEVVSSPCTAGARPLPRYAAAAQACREFEATQRSGAPAPGADEVRRAWLKAPSDGTFCPRTYAYLRAAAPSVRGREGPVDKLAPCDG